jgi:heptosyltransferase-2
MVEHYSALSELLKDGESLPRTQLAPKLNISSTAKQSVQNKLQNANISGDFIYVMCPGAEYGPTKRWPTEHFATLAQKLIAENPNIQIVLLGSKSDHILGQEITSQTKQANQLHNWCGNTSLDEAIALIGMSKAVVSNDSGLMHIAAALKTPQVAIFGSSDPAHTPPLSDRAQVIWLNMPCSPCHKRECPLGHLRCLKDILPEQVLATLNTLK